MNPGLAQPLLAGLRDRYVLEGELGRGGMATVYLARDLRSSQAVAIKLLHPELAATVGPERFLREIRLIARLDHPGILPLLESGECDGRVWYTMPYVAGGSLRQRLQQEPQFGIDEAVRIASQLANALEYAHRHGVVHRDIKPENVLLAGEDRRAVIADFGIAKLLQPDEAGRLTETGLALGTPSYMSPEQASGSTRLDARADVYALGCVLYEMLAGQPPFTGPTPQAIMARHAMEPVPSLRLVRDTVSPGLEAVVLKALAKVPADRFATAAELDAALARSAVAPVTVVGRRDGRRRRRALAGLAALGLLLLAGAAARALWAPGTASVLASASSIAVLPLVPSGPDTALVRLGRDLAATLSANLDGVGEIRTIDRLTMLAQVSEDRTLTLQDAASLGRKLGARSVVAGSLARDGPSVRLDLGLYTSDSLAPLAREVIVGSSDSLTALTDSATWRLLAAVWRRGHPPTPTIQAITTRSVEALRAYLDGERYLVAGRYADAHDAYGRAIAADSAFWFAYFRYGNSMGWYEGQVDSSVEAAYRSHLSLLPEKERALVAASRPDSGGRVQLRQLQDLVRRAPDYWPGSWVLADGLTHGFPVLGYGLDDAREALERTVELNPSLVYAWDHLLILYIDQWDTTAAERALASLEGLHGGAAILKAEGVDRPLLSRTQIALQKRALSADFLLDSLYQAALGKVAGGRSPWDEAIAFAWIGLPQVQIRMNTRLIRHGLSRDDRIFASEMLARSWAARGAWDSSLAVRDELAPVPADTSWMLDTYRTAVIGAWLGTLPDTEAIRRRAAVFVMLSGAAPRYRAELAWLDGVLALGRKDREAMASARAAVRASGARWAPLLDRSLGGFELALAGDHKGAGVALAALEWEMADKYGDGPVYGHTFLRGVDRLAAASWLAEAGDTAQAARLLTWFQARMPPFDEKIMLGPYAYLERARVEERRGRTQAAVAAYRQFLVRYDLPALGHRGLVEEARAAVLRLSITNPTPPDR